MYKFPQIDRLAQDEGLATYPKYMRLKVAKEIIAKLKKEKIKEIDYLSCIALIKKSLENQKVLRPLINATGVVIHTNLGRSLIHEEIIKRATPLLSSYTNLEFDIKSGKRGERYEELCSKLSLLFGCEDALVVNNNAAAVFLVLNSLAKNKEVITSRGELVEIGGSFRIPCVMQSARAKLVEVGTTNKTRLKDYELAINNNTAMLLKTHKSNFYIQGFSQEVNIKELLKLAKKNKLLAYYDLGSGHHALKNQSLIKNEPSVKSLLKHCHLLSFSADKLFGSVQAGIILGKKRLIKELKSNQLLRMLRVDKTHIALLNESVKAYLAKEYELIPTLSMLNAPALDIKKRAIYVQKLINPIKAELKESLALVGGGSSPNQGFKSWSLVFKGKDLQKSFRQKGVIARSERKSLILDFASIQEKELEKLASLIKELLG